MAAVVHPARTNNKAGKIDFVIAASGKEVICYDRLPAGSIRLSNDEKTCPLALHSRRAVYGLWFVIGVVRPGTAIRHGCVNC
jgi:hypothetical protein